MHLNREKFNPGRHIEIKLSPELLLRKGSLCCRRCCLLIQWKVDYGKFQPLKQPRSCNLCKEKNVLLPFHKICQECAQELALCAKCQKNPIKEKEKLLARAQREHGGDSEDESDDGSEVDADEAAAEAAQNGAGLDANGKKIIPKCCEGIYEEFEPDEEFRPLMGLNVAVLKRDKYRLQQTQEAFERDQLRERERRTVLRKMERAGKDGAEGGALEDDDSDVVMSDSDAADHVEDLA